MKVYEALAAVFRDSGIEVVFGLAGDDTVKLAAVLAASGVRYYGSRHECQAVSMADGYSRASGKLGLTILSRGPGFTNGLTAMVCAAKAGSSVLILAGDTGIGVQDPSFPARSRLNPKHVDQDAACAAAGVPAVKIISPSSAAADLRAVVARARQGCTFAVNVPIDVMEAEAGVMESTVTLPRQAQVNGPDPSQIAELADVLESGWAARKPVILAGRGAVRAGAGRELQELSKEIGALLTTSVGAHGLFSGNPYSIGICGTLSSPLASELLAQADLVLVFGAGLNHHTTYKGTMFPRARVIQIDSSEDAFGRHTGPPDMAIHADARAAAADLVVELRRRGFRSEGFRTLAVKAQLDDYKPEASFQDQSSPKAMDPRTLMVKLNTLIPRDRCLVVEGGHHVNYSAAYLEVCDPASFIFPIESFSIGLGMGAAIGAAVARPDRTTLLEIGDGGLLMTLGDLETSVRYHLPILIVVSNNDSLGSEQYILEAAGLPSDIACFPTPPFADLMRDMGGRGYTITSVTDLMGIARELAGRPSIPTLLDCRINADVRAPMIV